MRIQMKAPLSAIAIFLAGFGIAWWVKPDAASAGIAATPPRTRAERPTRNPSTKPTTDAFFQRVKEAEYDEDKRKAALDELPPTEIPTVLAELLSRTGVYGLDHRDHELFEELIPAWHAKAPDAALAWVQALKNKTARNIQLGVIAKLMAATDLDAALAMLRRNSTPDDNLINENHDLIKIAVTLGEDKLLEYCRLTLAHNVNTSSCGLSGTSVISLSYPAEFDFQRVLNSLAEAKAKFAEGYDFGAMPSNLLSEWAKRDYRAAWAWLQQGKELSCAGTNDFLEGYATVAKPNEVGAFLASSFNPASKPTDQYKTAWNVISGHIPSPVVIDSFLQAAAGDRTSHLNGLFDQSSLQYSSYDDKAVTMILERMDPATRVAALRRRFSESGASEENRNILTPALRGLGHSEEEIQSLLPPSKQ